MTSSSSAPELSAIPDVAENLCRVQQRIAEAATRSGRDPAGITLVAVSKTMPVSAIEEAIAAGVEDLGENYAQEFRSKYAAIGGRVRWHFIGHLQTNKVKYVVPHCALIHGVDSERLAAEIGRRARGIAHLQPILLEVNVAGEKSKFGLAPEQALQVAPAVAGIEGVALRGLMTMPPWPDDPEDSRPYYVALREVAEELCQQGLAEQHLRELSMGMTSDLEVAIEEGATIVRVGTGIFGPRL